MSARDTRSAIRDAAIRLIATKGFDQTSLREVADEVGITKASLYYHYASKADLLVAIVGPVLDEIGSIATALDETSFTDDDVRPMLGRYIASLVRHRETGVLFVRDAIPIMNAIGDRFPEVLRINERMRTWLAGPHPTVEQQLRAAATLEVLGIALTSNELVPEASVEEVERVLLDVAMSVLRADHS
jgi:AcrR family transcriptional regulator